MSKGFPVDGLRPERAARFLTEIEAGGVTFLL